MSLTESLTVLILGDSSGLQQELGQVADSLAGLQQQLGDLSGSTSQFGEALQGLASASRPLQGISTQLSTISEQLQAIANQPVMIDVSSAIVSLQQLLQAAQAAAQQLAALSLGSMLGGMITSTTLGGGDVPARGYATGGLVSGPAGIDQVSARLTAGEYVLNPSAVAAIGIRTLDRMNENGERPASLSPTGTLPIPSPANTSAGASEFPTAISGEQTHSVTFPVPWQSNGRSQEGVGPGVQSSSLPSRAIGSPQTNNHFGGIAIHVQEATEMDQLLRSLRLEGIGLRHRRG